MKSKNVLIAKVVNGVARLWVKDKNALKSVV